jgi:hypothetical protein
MVIFDGHPQRIYDTWDQFKEAHKKKCPDQCVQSEDTPDGVAVWFYDGPMIYRVTLTMPADVEEYRAYWEERANGPA